MGGESATETEKKMRRAKRSALVAALGILLIVGNSMVWAERAFYITEVRSIYTKEVGLEYPGGLSYSADEKVLIIVDRRVRTQPNLVRITPYEELIGAFRFPIVSFKAMKIAYDKRFSRLLVVGKDSEILGVKTKLNELLNMS
jgi:hypothetical protein